MSAEVIRRLYAARARGDVAEAQSLLHPDVVWREPGAASYSGERRGAQSVLEGVHERTLEATGGTFRLDVEGLLEHGPLVVALVRWSATRHGRSMTGREVAVYTVRDGRVVDACFHLDDVAATDAFFA